MRLHPIASALGRNKTGLILIALQVALTLAIVVNSLFIILQRLEKMGREQVTVDVVDRHATSRAKG